MSELRLGNVGPGGIAPRSTSINPPPTKKQTDMTSTGTVQERWRRVRERLQTELGDDVFTSWFGRMELDAVQMGVVRLSVPTRFLRNWIQSHYSERVLTKWQEEEPEVTRLELSVRSATIRPPMVKPKAPEPPMLLRETRAATGNGSDMRASVPYLTVHEALDGSPLDPRLTFETFVVGRSNTLAHAAAKQVATSRRGDPLMFNPLYTHAAVGLGKTHLLQAITWAGNGSSDRKMLYLTAERFMYGFVSALRTQTTLAFKEAVRAIDVLVIDDLQFLQGRSTQAEFCHTLNTLIDAGRQVVIASDRPPSDLESLDDRVRSRLAGGLVVEIGSLGEDLRLEILKSRVGAARLHHPGFEVPAPVLSFIAKSVTHNGRDLEGAVNRLLAHNKLTGQPVTLEMAEREMRDLIRPAEPKRVRIEDIQRVVARQYNVSRSDLLSSRRTANVVRPRQVAMYLAKVLTLRSLPEIGRRFGGRDHTTVLHAVRKIENLAGNDSAFAEEIEALKRQLQD
jgi:chromosomal replication initiator protein